MLSPPHSAPVRQPVTSPPATPTRHRTRWVALALGVIALLAAVAFPLAPVQQPRVEISWSSATDAPATAIPLMPYQPISLTVTVPCDAARGVAPGRTVLLSTVPLDPDPLAPVLPGLRVEVVVDAAQDGLLRVTSFDRVVAEDPVPAQGGCAWTVTSDPDRTAVTRDGQQVGAVDADVRPGVAGVFSEAGGAAGLSLRLLADTRFHTTITPVKVALAVLGVAALAGALVAVRATDRGGARGRRLRLLPPRWWRPRPVDLAVTAALGLWAVVGPISVDDGYIAGIIRSRASNGFSGNVYRWLNAPEAPFSYIYELYALWSTVSLSPLWLRIPSVLLGLLTWFLLSRALLPRLGRFTAGWTTAAVFAAWWLPFNLGIRPEPWLAAGGVAVLCAVERGIATRRVLPLLLGLVIVGATVAITPTGIVTGAPYLAALFPVLRVVRARTDLHRAPLAVLAAAAPASALLLMFADQTYGSVAESIRVRTLIGGGLPWYQEYARYARLLDPGELQGALQARVPVLLALLSFAGLAWGLHRRTLPGIAAGPARRVLLTTALSLALMTFTPTKWTMHFGAVAGVGTALLVVAFSTWSGTGLRAMAAAAGPAARPAREVRTTAAGIAGVTVAGSLALAGLHQYPYVSNYGITWSTRAPVLFGYPMSDLALAAGLLLAGGLLLWSAWRQEGGQGQQLPPWVPTPAGLALLLVIATVALQLGSFTRTSVERRDTYTVANQNLDELARSSCGLADYLLVEPDPRAGLLPPLPGAAAETEGFVPAAGAAVPLELAGDELPGWAATGAGGTVTTGWFSLGAGELPLVVTISGDLGPRDDLVAEFGTAEGRVVGRVAVTDQPGAPQPRDIRLDQPGADAVRLVATDGGGPGEIPLAVSGPRSPQLVPMTELVPPGTTAIVDWPVAFVFPCVEFAALPPGTAELPQWRIAPPTYDEDAADITYAPQNGGPFLAPRLLVQEQRIPVYLQGEPLRDVVGLKRWVPITPLGGPATSRTTTTVPGWERIGRATVPGLDLS